MKNSSDLILIDTNVLLYALDKQSKDSFTSKQFIDENCERLVIAHQTINEYIRIATHVKFTNRLSNSEIDTNIRIFLSTFAKVICPDSASLEYSLHLIKKYNITGRLVFDTYLVATALTNSIHTVATYNAKDFQVFKPEGLSLITF